MALPVLLGVGCENDSADLGALQNEREIVELQAALSLAQYRYEQAGGDARFEAGSGAVDGAAAGVRLSAVQAERDLLAAELEGLESELAVFRKETVQRYRQSVIGKSFAELEAGGGRVYTDASVASISDSGVVIRHRDGSARLAYNDLTPEQRELFALDATDAKLAEERELQALAQYERALDRQMAVVEREQRIAAAASAAEAKASAASRALMLASVRNERRERASLLSEPARSIGRSSRSHYTYFDGYTYYSSRPTIFYRNNTSPYANLRLNQLNNRTAFPSTPPTWQPRATPAPIRPPVISPPSLPCP